MRAIEPLRPGAYPPGMRVAPPISFGAFRDSAMRVWALLPVLLVTVLAAAGSARAQDEPDSCLECHDMAGTHAGAPEGFRLDGKGWRATPHAASCLMCHEDMEEVGSRRGFSAWEAWQSEHPAASMFPLSSRALPWTLRV